MFKCPYCFEVLPTDAEPRCDRCQQFILDDIINVEFPSLDKKPCLFCGKNILIEAKICRYCRRWLDEISRAVEDIDPEDLV